MNLRKGWHNMAHIRTRITKKNDEKYHVMIRKKGIEIHKSFGKKEDAELYTKWKESIIDNLENFDVAISNTITIEALFDMKLETVGVDNKRTYNDISNTKKNLLTYIDDKKFASDMTFEDWKNLAKQLYDKDVYRGAKSGNNMRKISLETLRKFFAYCSTCYSHAQTLGIELENHPLRVIQTFLKPLAKNKDKKN
jgi:hypothetical protein